MNQDAPAARRVLVVEDEFFIARDLVDALRSDGFDILGPVGSVLGELPLLGDASSLTAQSST